MLTEGILEDDFDKNGDAWCAQRDLEHDLHLAAKLGKTLLDRNRELEQALQQMYSTNQEQLLEIEYLAKQVELLRHMNDQHAKVYEQLDLSTKELERGNKRLVQDDRLAQNKISSLNESIDGLQTHMEGLQKQVEALTSAQSERNKQEQRRHLGAQSVSCLKGLYDLHQDRRQIEGPLSPQGSVYDRNRRQDPEEEHEILLRSVQTLQAQLGAEKIRREAAERELELTANDKEGLEQRLHLLVGCRTRQMELQAQVEQLRLVWRADCTARKPDQLLLPDSVFYTSDDKPEADLGESDETGEEKDRQQQRSNSTASAPDDHDKMCVRRAEVVKQRGILLLNEVDAQYNALQVKYDQLLQQCQQATAGLTHKSVQTSCSPSTSVSPRCRLSGMARQPSLVSEEPEYKVLFKEIFTRIQKTKEDLHENKLVSDASTM
ncbi:cerebellar degeneration-related protein 2 isoform X2 [Hippocampus zosterae]|uniref:cerebellar degeneration-related protein 2 isoform X2 n=1 Tax=Hippocampus zosterae TaxID=109293 RepID=UPI00223CDB9D|nr:cerebellar degeneration-related protein 2 isoform X2 [Hippocampus zosterae]